MQVFRLVQSGQVDRVIAFDELPKRLLDGVDLQPPSGLPRAWREFVGVHTKITPAVPERDPLTHQVKMVGGAKETGPFFYILYYKEINKDKERWQEIASFVRRAVDLKFRLLDKLEDMALPMGVDAMSELKLEPEDLETSGAIIPIPEEFQEKNAPILDKDGKELPVIQPPQENQFKCVECEKAFKNEQAIKMHVFRKHPKREEQKQPVTA